MTDRELLRSVNELEAENTRLSNHMEELRALHTTRLAECQAREAALREALEESYALNSNWSSEADAYSLEYYSEYRAVIKMGKEALALPTDDTALKDIIKQAKREALLEAAGAFFKEVSEGYGGHSAVLRWEGCGWETRILKEEAIAFARLIADTALKDALKAAKREALLEAAYAWEFEEPKLDVVRFIRRMAEELE